MLICQGVPGEFYHVYNRGNNREMIFFERDNYGYFLRKVRTYILEESPDAQLGLPRKAVNQPVADVVAYCLMTNHFHFLVKLNASGFSKAMQSLSQSYANAINKRFARVGSLFQGRFQAIRVDREEYLMHLTRYIHLNPVEAGLVQLPEDWEFSSYRDYVGLRDGSIPKKDVIIEQFPTREDYKRFVLAGIGRIDSKVRDFVFDESIQ